MPRTSPFRLAALAAGVALALMTAGAECATPRDAVEGTVVLSTGETISGKVFLTRGKRLRVYDDAQQCYRDFKLKKFSRLAINVKRQRMEREWRFKEEGNPEKVYTGRQYPRLDFTLTATLKNGRNLTSNIARGQPLYVQPVKGKRRRFLIQPHLQGKPEQTPGHLVYMKEVVFQKLGTAPKDKTRDAAAVEKESKEKRAEPSKE